MTDTETIEEIKRIQTIIMNERFKPKTEEATKQWLILPIIKALGYDIFSPDVIPEYTADVGTKNGERLDYLLRNSNNECILIECKDTSVNLSDKQTSQLFRYYTSLISKGEKIKTAILTNGKNWWFFSDTKTPNIMDTSPIYKINLDTNSTYGLDYFLRYKRTPELPFDDTLKRLQEIKEKRKEKRDKVNNHLSLDDALDLNNINNKYASAGVDNEIVKAIDLFNEDKNNPLLRDANADGTLTVNQEKLMGYCEEIYNKYKEYDKLDIRIQLAKLKTIYTYIKNDTDNSTNMISKPEDISALAFRIRATYIVLNYIVVNNDLQQN